MSYSILYTPDFEKQLKRLAKKYLSLRKDLSALVKELQVNPTTGVALGNNCYKIRLAISSKGKGKSAGARIITCVIVSDKEVYLAAIFDKSERDNITDLELKEIIKTVKG